MTAPLVSFSQRWTLFQHLQFIIEKKGNNILDIPEPSPVFCVYGVTSQRRAVGIRYDPLFCRASLDWSLKVGP